MTTLSRQLASKLKDYRIYSETIRFGYETPKGYELAQFQNSFDRYLSQHPQNLPQHRNISIEANTDNSLSVADDIAFNIPKRNTDTDVAATLNQKATSKPLSTLDCDSAADKTLLAQKCVRI